MQISYLPIQLNKDFQSESVFANEKLILFMVMKKCSVMSTFHQESNLETRHIYVALM